MATNTLTDQNISDTYKGILHARGTVLPGTGQTLLYDGDGNATSLRVGVWGQGSTIIGSLSVNSMLYPIDDGAAGEFIQTDGNGILTFASLATSDLPTLSPNPTGTYTGLSSITVDSTGRVTQVKQSAGGAANTSQYRYASPINLIDTPNDLNQQVDTTQANMPTDATYAIIRIDFDVHWDQSGSGGFGRLVIDINGVRAVYAGSTDPIRGGGDEIGYSGVQEWYAKIDGSNEFNIDIDSTEARIYPEYIHKVVVDLMGYANFQEISNP